ncbi:MAG: hypothetical protein ACOYB4_02080 [Methyloceanibacter sp.]
MRTNKIREIVNEAKTYAQDAANLLVRLQQFVDATGQAFDVRKAIRETDSSVSQIVSRIQTAAGVVAEFESSSRADLVPAKVLSNLQTSIQESRTSIENVGKLVDSIGSQGGAQTFNYKNMQVQTRNGQTQSMDGQFQSLYSTSETFLVRFFDSVQILKPRGAYSFQAASNSLTQVLDKGHETLEAIRGSLQRIATAEKSLDAKEKDAAAKVNEIERHKNNSENDRKTIGEYLEQATQQKVAIQAVHQEAVDLEAAVEAYQASFDKFQAMLDERNKIFEQGTTSLTGLIEDFEAQSETTQNLVTRAEEMLSSATVAGLAANFAEMMNKLTKELRWARRAFYFGILLLMVSAIPLLAFVLFPIIAPLIGWITPEMLENVVRYGPGSADNGWQYLGQVLARIAILIPAAWFVSFTAIRHSSLFRLREHYAYKYSMAVSVEGFKKQAPDYEQEIAAMVLEQLAFNPTDKLIASKDIKEGKMPGLAGHLFERIRTKLEGQSAKTK